MHISNTIVNNGFLLKITFVSFLWELLLYPLLIFQSVLAVRENKWATQLKHIVLLRNRKNKQVRTPFIYFHRKVNPPPLHCCCALTDHGIPDGAERIPEKAVLCCRMASLKAHSSLSCTCIICRIFCTHEYRKLLLGQPWVQRRAKRAEVPFFLSSTSSA